MNLMPMHERIRAEIESAILSGELAPGDKLPFESALMADYGCARMTVNKALTALANAGLVERRRRAGTFVMRPKVHSMILEVPDIALQVRERGQAYEFELASRTVRDPDTLSVSENSLAMGGQILVVEGRHLADGEPLALERRLVSVAAVPDLLDVDFKIIAPGSWLLQHVPWTEAATRISAISASKREAAELRVTNGSACLCVERRTWRRTDRITEVRQLFRGDAYDLLAHFGATGGNRRRSRQASAFED